MEEEAVKKIVVAIIVLGSISAMGYGFYTVILDKGDDTGSSTNEPTGGILPELYFRDQYGERKEIHDYKGKYLIVDLTGIECIYCPNQYENLTRIRSMYPPSQVQILSIEMWNKAGDWSVTLERMGNLRDSGEISWLYGVDEFGDFAYSYETLVPRIVILDPYGYVIYEPKAGVVSWETMAQVLP